MFGINPVALLAASLFVCTSQAKLAQRRSNDDAFFSDNSPWPDYGCLRAKNPAGVLVSIDAKLLVKRLYGTGWKWTQQDFASLSYDYLNIPDTLQRIPAAGNLMCSKEQTWSGTLANHYTARQLFRPGS